jgi:hypothetical protein
MLARQALRASVARDSGEIAATFNTLPQMNAPIMPHLH